MKFKIITSCTAISEYEVEATDREGAEAKFWNGEFSSEKITDYRDEEIVETLDDGGENFTGAIIGLDEGGYYCAEGYVSDETAKKQGFRIPREV